MRHVGNGAEKGPDLHGQGDGDRATDRGDQLQVAVLHLQGRGLGIGGQVVDVQLQGVGPGLLDHLAVVDPAAVGGAVETGDHRDRQRLLGLADQPEIGVGPGVVVLHLRQVRLGLGEAFIIEVVQQRDLDFLTGDLLLEQRGKNDSRGPGLFQLHERVDSPRERAGRRDQGILQVQTQVLGA